MSGKKRTGSRLAHSLIAAVTALPLALSTGCPTPDGTTTTEPVITIQTENGITQIPADGSSQLRVTIRAFDADGAPDNSQMEVVVDRGAIVASDFGSPAAEGRQLVAQPIDGEASFDFQCGLLDDGAVRVTVTNGSNATTSRNLSCLEPQGTLTVDVNDDDCLGLEASGADSCEVSVAVDLALSGGTVNPQANASLTATVTGVTNVTLGDGTPGADTDGDRGVLAVSAASSGQSFLDLATNTDGEATFFIVSDEVGLQQTMTIELTGTTVDDRVLPTQTITVVIGPFVNQTDVSLNADRQSVTSGDTVNLIVSATDEAGDPADTAANAQHTVTVSIDDPEAVLTFGDQSTTANDLELVVDLTAGSADLSLTTPELEATDAPRTINITAEFQPVDSLPAVSNTIAVNVSPEGALLLNALVSPDTIASDVTPPENATITVTVQKDGNLMNNQDINFAVRSSDVERIGIGPALDLATVVNTGTDDSGTAVISVFARNNRVRGRTVVEISTVDATETPPVTVTTEVEIDIERDPILQSVVFVSAAPDTIGVLGGSNQSSTVVTFKVLDDLNAPMANVPVTFDTPSTADPDASVVGYALTGGDGNVSTVLSAGTRAGPIAVIATAQFDGIEISVQSDPIAVTGGLVSFSNSYITCDPATVVQQGAHVANCSMTLADRFTNTAPGVAVQYRSEAGNITPNVVGGTAANFVSGQPGRGSADVTDWSYGVVIPTAASDIQTNPGDNFDPVGCFDNGTATACDLYTLCLEGSNTPFCPLPLDPDTGEGCWENIPQVGFALMGHSAPFCTVTASGDDDVITCDDGTTATVPDGLPMTAFKYGTDTDLRAAYDDFRSKALSCGYSATCLVGRRDGVGFVDGDECPVSAGCLDFSVGFAGGGGTVCQNDGLFTITASVTGEEGFVDENGNGIFDYDDANGNGAHDPGEASEAFVDMPEVFLDKNDNCYFDELDGSLRLEPIEEIRLSDLFSDEDESDDFGYQQIDGSRTLSNGRWDTDKQLFFQARLLNLIGDPRLMYGELCSPADAAAGPGGYTCADGTTATCYETGNGFGYAQCIPFEIVDPQLQAVAGGAFDDVLTSFSLDYAWTDALGNCHNVGWTQNNTVGANGPVKVSGTTTGPLGYCAGIGDKGQGVTNVFRPYCEDFPNLGATPRRMSVAADCKSTEGPTLAEISIAHSSGENRIFTVNVICPFCGDGFLTGDEQCEVGDANCENCEIVQP